MDACIPAVSGCTAAPAGEPTYRKHAAQPRMPVTVAQRQRLFSQAQSVSASEIRARGSRAGYALAPCSTTARNPIVTLRQLLCVLNPGAETGLPSQESRVRHQGPQLG